MESLLTEENLHLMDFNLSLSGQNVSCILEDNVSESCQDFLAEEEKDYLYKVGRVCVCSLARSYFLNVFGSEQSQY